MGGWLQIGVVSEKIGGLVFFAPRISQHTTARGQRGQPVFIPQDPHEGSALDLQRGPGTSSARRAEVVRRRVCATDAPCNCDVGRDRPHSHGWVGREGGTVSRFSWAGSPTPGIDAERWFLEPFSSSFSDGISVGVESEALHTFVSSGPRWCSLSQCVSHFGLPSHRCIPDNIDLAAFFFEIRIHEVELLRTIILHR